MTKIYGTQIRQIGSWYADEAWFAISIGINVVVHMYMVQEQEYLLL